MAKAEQKAGPKAGRGKEMTCLRQGLEGRVMDVVGMSWGRNRMEAKKRGVPGLVGSQKAN